MTRQKRNSKIPQEQFLVPLDITRLGSEDDPCFGKHWDPRVAECKRCGDSEACTIAMQNKLTLRRGVIEGKKSFMDLVEPKVEGEQYMDTAPVIAYLKAKYQKYDNRIKAIRLTMRKFKLEKPFVKDLAKKHLKMK